MTFLPIYHNIVKLRIQIHTCEFGTGKLISYEFIGSGSGSETLTSVSFLKNTLPFYYAIQKAIKLTFDPIWRC